MNTVYIATSLDGHIADKNGAIEWLSSIPNPDGSDLGFADFMNRMDALVMGRNTFETVLAFDCPWPYAKHVYVLSTTLTSQFVPDKVKEFVTVVSGNLTDVIASIHAKGHKNLYIDGGKTIQSFFQQNLIDEMIITTIPVVLGGGIPLFRDLERPVDFELVGVEVLLGQLVKHHYRKIARRVGPAAAPA